jgi:hypothetical protein
MHFKTCIYINKYLSYDHTPRLPKSSIADNDTGQNVMDIKEG